MHAGSSTDYPRVSVEEQGQGLCKCQCCELVNIYTLPRHFSGCSVVLWRLKGALKKRERLC